MRFMKRKFLVALLCLCAAAALTWRLFDMAESTKATETVIRVSARVEKGTPITRDMLRSVEVGAYGLEASAVRLEEEIIGQCAAADLYPGDNLTPEKFEAPDSVADGYVQKTRDTGMTAVSVDIKGIAAGLSGKLKKGDVVSALVFAGRGGAGEEEGGVRAYPELKYLEVAGVANNRAEDVERSAERERARGQSDTLVPAAVLFIADEAQALRLVEAANLGNIHLVFRGRGEYGRRLLSEYYEGLN